MRPDNRATFAQEVQLERPARSFGERLFRLCLCFFVFASLGGSLAQLVGVEKKIGAAMDVLALPFSIAFIFSLLYLLIYAGRHYTPQRKVTWKLWLLILGVPTLAVVAFSYLE